LMVNLVRYVTVKWRPDATHLYVEGNHLTLHIAWTYFHSLNKTYLKLSPWLVSRFLGPNLSKGTKIPLLLLLLGLKFVYNRYFTLSSVWMSEPYFLTYPLCLLKSIYTCTMCSWHLPVQKAKSCGNFYKPRFLKKRMDHPPWKVSLFVGHEFSHESDNKLHLKFDMERLVLMIYRMM
jgi:hypothetical protein